MSTQVEAEPVFLASENPNPVMRVDLKTTLSYANEAASVILAMWGIKEGGSLPEDAAFLCQEALRSHRVTDLEVTTGDEQVVLLRFTPYPERGYCNVYGFDITPRKIYKQQLDRLGCYDELTGLHNRKYFINQLRHHIVDAKRTNHLIAIFAIGIKGLTMIYHTLGQYVADALLCEIAKRLKTCLPGDGLLARISDSQFIMAEGQLGDEGHASALAQRLIDTLSEPYSVQNHVIDVNIIVGIALYPRDADDAFQCVSNALLVLDREQPPSANTYQFYRRYMSAVVSAKRKLLHDLRHALERDELMLYYQPIVEAETGRVLGVESLVRWQHPTHGLLTPRRFASLAEERGLIVPIGTWALERSITQSADWDLSRYQNFQIAVNISPLQFRRPDFIDQVKAVMEIHGDVGITLEITETTLIDNLTYATKILQTLRDMGVKIAIDDFGTGYSSLSYLQHLPIDIIKIDRSFVQAICQVNQHSVIIESVIALAHKLDLTVVAEGVETQNQADFLIEQGCGALQGYLISPPITAEQLGSWLSLQKAS